jgi:UDP-GlcNAc:undecaprenyl-phosphate/decaprenyl-phosphate GlcNAc-1-phosphate transferase
MTTLAVILGLSYGLCSVLTPIARALGTRYGLCDHPDGGRKMHPRPIPVLGGIVILLSGTAGLCTALVAPNPFRDTLHEQLPHLLGLLLGAVVICGVGTIDDFRRLRGRYKLLGQLVAVAIVMASGLSVQRIRLFDWQLELGLLAIPFTVFWLLGAINSLNLIDGMDGLLGSMGLIISLAMAAMAILGQQWGAACLAIALAGAMLGFLPYNLPPASIFLGDSGSMLIGLVVGVLALQSSLKAPATVALAAPIAVLTIPIFDTAAAIIRRKLTGRSLYVADRGHLHHCLLRRGLSSGRVLLAISTFCLLSLAGALASLACNHELLALLSALAVVAILITTRVFGYTEFLLAKDHLVATAVSLFPRPANGSAHQIEIRLQGSIDWKVLWTKLTVVAAQLRLASIRLEVSAPAGHEAYHACWNRLHNSSGDPSVWRAQIPLLAERHPFGLLEVTGLRESTWDGLAVARMVQLVEDYLALVCVPPSAVNGFPPRAKAAASAAMMPVAAVMPVNGWAG